MMKNAAFDHVLELSLSEFLYEPPPYGALAFRCSTPTPLEQRYENFAEELLNAVGERYLPVYRMADGEFAFVLGKRPARASGRTVRAWLAEKTVGFRPQALRTCWGEDYPRHIRKAALRRMEQALRIVTESGYVALYFALRPDRWSEEYHDPVLHWFAENRIALNEGNAIPFYLVYALLNGRYRSRLLAGRAVLVVTSLATPSRRARIESGLRAEGVASVQFIEISPNASMLDHIELSQVHGNVDLALVAAGIGSVNVLAQLQPLGVPVIDCGIALECYVDPQRRWERPFLIDTSRVGPHEIRRHRQF
jgi:hypothetical protein